MKKDSDPVLQQSFLTAQACHQRGDLASAEAIYSRLLAIDPADAEVLYLFGYLQISKGAVDTGLECLRLAQQLQPGNPRIPYTIGVVLQERACLDGAIEAYRQALAIDPEHRESLENLCSACYDSDDFANGLAAAQCALALAPDSLLAIRGVANCLAAMGRRTEALAAIAEGVRRHPATPELRLHHAWELLANGCWAEGWTEMEWRYARLGVNDAPPRSVPFPRWNGEALAGKTVLVYGEQGIGDEIMYAPFVHAITRAGGRCILECEARLERLFARAFPQCTLLARSDREQIHWSADLGQIDFCISSMSLPRFSAHPVAGAKYLAADPERVDYWRSRLDALPGRKIGISWRGGAIPKVQKIRSIAPALFGQLADDGLVFVSLQYGASVAEVAAVAPGVLHFPEVDALQDLDEFAALIAALDTVVSVDNSTVHLAGALGIPTLLMLPVFYEWRWGNASGGSSPWYRSVEMIRQREASEAGWKEVLAKVRDRLAGMVELSASPKAEADGAAAATILRPVAQGKSAMLLADTHYWYHWGCACTSLGLHEGLRPHFKRIEVMPLRRLLSGCPAPTGLDSLDSDEFFRQFEQRCPDIVAVIRAVDWVVINGEGSIHGAHPLPLFMLYLAYVARRRFGRQVALVNHSSYPGTALLPNGVDTASAYYARTYAALDSVVVREPISLENVRLFYPGVQLGFDCLPRFLAAHGPFPAAICERKLVLGGSVAWNAEMVACFANLAGRMQAQGYAVEILSGAKALLAADEIGFVEAMSAKLAACGVDHQICFALSEQEWLQHIAGASLLVSGRFHYSVAAAFLQVPFLVAESNTAKIAGMLMDFGLEVCSHALLPANYENVIDMADRLLVEGLGGVVFSERLLELRQRCEKNFGGFLADAR